MLRRYGPNRQSLLRADPRCAVTNWVVSGQLYWPVEIEQKIAEIERLERLFEVPDTRPLGASDIAAANRRHDEELALSPWFKLWQSYGICCRPLLRW